ncbi:MAG: AAA domain-containing protein [Planctomycetota bacterium]
MGTESSGHANSGSAIVRFLRACYEADNRETAIRNLRDRKNRHVRFFSGDDVGMNGTIGRYALPKTFGEKLRKDVFQYRRDKSLVLAAFPVIGNDLKGRGKSQPKRMCAPLVFFPAEVEQGENGFFLIPRWNELQFNWPVLNQLATDEGGDADELTTSLMSFQPPPWTREQVHSLAAVLSEALPRCDFRGLAPYPKLIPKGELEDVFERAGQQRQCVAAVACALLPNSPDTRGVFHELESLAETPEISDSLNALWRGDPRAWSNRECRRPSLAPATLSDAQKRVLQSARHQELTLVNGPPGTGKSLTIAAVALDALARGQSVLIASRMDQAVDVVERKLGDLLGDDTPFVRAGRKAHKRELKRKLQDLLAGVGHATSPSTVSSRVLYRKLRAQDRFLAKFEDALTRNHGREIEWGRAVAGPKTGWLDRIGDQLGKAFREWQLAEFDAWESMGFYESQLHQRTRDCQAFLQQTLAERVTKLLEQRREELARFRQALTARSDGKQQRLFAETDFSALLTAFPVWLCKLSDLANVLPLRKHLFDVVILDEASQCDIASSLPLLQRGKRAVVVGDPNQLRHVSFLAESRLEAFADECRIGESERDQFHYRRQSILHASLESIQESKAVIFLDEHFRSLPRIIAFSNDEFYRGRLALMRHRRSTEEPAVCVREVSGKRSKRGSNASEADAIVGWIKSEIRPPNSKMTVGVLSPFRAQVDFLAKEIESAFTYAELKQMDLLVGTAHTFQGEERDVMLVSLALDQDSHWAAFRFLENPNLLNVAITRARHQQVVFKSFSTEILAGDSLLRRWLESMSDKDVGKAHRPQGESAYDAFREEVAAFAANRGWATRCDVPLAGILIDLTIQSGSRTIGVDLIGYPGATEAAYTLERYRMLSRSGLQVFPLSYRQWIEQRSVCEERIAAAFRE